LSPSQTGGKVVACRFPERWVAATDKLIEIAVEDACSGLKQQMSATLLDRLVGAGGWVE
jgi:hypothetical protein